MNVRQTILSALFLGTTLGAPTAASADETYNWSGFYVGAFIGGGHATFSDDANGAFASGNGVLGGGGAGYQHQLGGLVLGAEADIAAAGIDDAYDAGLIVNGGHVSLDAVGTVRARVGYASDRVQIYGTGGFAYGRVADRFAGRADANWMGGWAAGGGAAYALTDALSVDLRYLHVDLGPTSFFGGAARESVRADVVTLGLNYRF